MTTGKKPKVMLSPNTKTDYGKLKRLIRLDKLDGDRRGTLTKIAENGEITGHCGGDLSCDGLDKA